MTENLKETYYGKKIDTCNILNIDEAVKFAGDKPIVFITGVTGQDGSLMVDYLLEKTDYIIFGGVRRLSVYNHKNISHINSDRFHLINFDLTDPHAIARTVEKLQPNYFVNFAAQSFVASSWDFARQTWQTNCTAVLDILEAIRLHKPDCRLYQAGSSEEFGDIVYSPQDEDHPLRPRSPYAASKAASRQLIKVYRESYNLYAVQGWLFNHEGPRRGEEFVTRKISKKVSAINWLISNGHSDFEPLELGNIDASRDWSDAEDFVDGVWRMLNQDIYNENYYKENKNAIPYDYVFSSNETHSIREFVKKAFLYIGLDGYWENETGDPKDEKFVIYINGIKKVLMQINKKFYRPAEVEALLGNSEKARKELGWVPKSSFNKLVEKMLQSDIDSFNKIA
jgi:GDPmannose 4,6-dehydratase